MADPITPQTPGRVVHEYVPGKEITLAHLIASPQIELCEKLGIRQRGAIGILTFTPVISVIVAGDIGTKAADVEIGFIDRFTGALVLVGTVADVRSALEKINQVMEKMGFKPAPLTIT